MKKWDFDMRQVSQTSFFGMCPYPTYNLWVMSGENVKSIVIQKQKSFHFKY